MGLGQLLCLWEGALSIPPYAHCLLTVLPRFSYRCGHCVALKPAWIEAATSLNGKVRMGAVDCTDNQGVCGKYGIR